MLKVLCKCFFVAVCVMSMVSMSFAYDFSGTSSGIFTNPVGPSGMVVTGVGRSNFTWGDGFNSPPSSLNFSGTGFTDNYENEFKIGTLSYFNGTITSGTEADSVNLLDTLTFSDPSGITKNFNFTFQLINTPNTTDPIASADYIYLAQLYDPSAYFTVGGINYYLQFTRFGNISNDGFSPIPDEFHVLESGSGSADMFAKLTVSPTNSVPEPSTLLLLGAGLLGLGSLRKKFKS